LPALFEWKCCPRKIFYLLDKLEESKMKNPDRKQYPKTGGKPVPGPSTKGQASQLGGLAPGPKGTLRNKGAKKKP
jgi:hypothetical protein